MTQGSTSIVTLNQNNELIDENELREVTTDFSKLIDELDKAIQQTKDAGELATRVQDKGFFSLIGGSFTGSNTKDLAESIKILGASVETTQKIIEVILKINKEKNKFLKNFHSALTDKILSLSKEMEVSYGNQKNAKQATITIATQLRSQIEEKIRHSEMIDEHEVEISKLQYFAQAKESLDDEQSQAIIELKENAIKKDDLDYQQSQDIETLKDISSLKDRLDSQQSDDIKVLTEKLNNLNLVFENQSNEIKMLKEKDIQKDQRIENQFQKLTALADKNDALQDALELTTSNFNAYVVKCNSTSYKLKLITLPLISIIIASAAFLLAFR